jgi:hypothetical protein
MPSTWTPSTLKEINTTQSSYSIQQAFNIANAFFGFFRIDVVASGRRMGEHVPGRRPFRRGGGETYGL